jgi:hypothetical protein
MAYWVGITAARRHEQHRRRLVSLACRCARLALPYAIGSDAESGIELAEDWARGDDGVTSQRLRATSAHQMYAELLRLVDVGGLAAFSERGRAFWDGIKGSQAAGLAAGASGAAVSIAATYASLRAGDSNQVISAAFDAMQTVSCAVAAGGPDKSALLIACGDLVRAEYPRPPDAFTGEPS